MKDWTSSETQEMPIFQLAQYCLCYIIVVFITGKGGDGMVRIDRKARLGEW